MNFDELQVIWDSQSDRPTFQWDEKSMIKDVQQRSKAFGRQVGWFDTAMIGCLLFMAGMCLRDPVLEGHDLFLALPALACMAGAWFLWSRRQTRLKRAIQYDESLLGVTEKSIAEIDDHISRLRSIGWWCALPLAFTMAVAFFLVDGSKRYLITFVFSPLLALSMGLSYWGAQKEIRCKLIPKKADLESLRNKILS